MKPKSSLLSCLVITSIITISSSLIYGQSGIVQGRIVDKLTGEKLVGANILIEGTVIGAATNIDGEFRISSVSAGKRILKASYIGYKSKEIEIEIFAGKVSELEVKLDTDIIEGEEVVVTGQLKGQQRAINEQLSSNTIINVVSKDKLQELPDQNAAETISRMSGIAILRNAGEGSKVIVRGLSPKFNAITMNGERIPSTDPVDRSVDLSMISSEMLEGIEVYKALTPNMDADAVGGTVNFVVRKAPDQQEFRLKLLGNFNNHAEDFGNYQFTGSYGRRFLDDNLGLLVNANIEDKNRSSHQLTASYNFLGQEVSDLKTAIVGIDDLNLGDRIENRKRYGFSFTADYDFGLASNVLLNSFWNKSDRDEIRRRKRYRVSTSRVEYDLRDSEIENTIWTNTLQGNHVLYDFIIDWRASYSTSRNLTPFEHAPTFREDAAFTSDLIDDQGPELIPGGAKNDTSNTHFKWDRINKQEVNEKSLTAQLDLSYDYMISDLFTGKIKAGGKIRSRDRDFDDNSLWTSHFNLSDLGLDMRARPDYYRQNYKLYTLADNGAVGFVDFIDPSFSTTNFLDGAYEFNLGISPEKVEEFYKIFKDYTFADGDKLYVTDPLADLNDYSASEKIYAAYLMGDINLGPRVILLGGVRYEYTRNDYKSIFGTPIINDEGQSVSGVTDTAGNRYYDNWLPMVHLRYKATDWMDIRLAVTKSISRPNYFNLVPKEILNGDDRTITIGDPNLKPTQVWNYDIFVSFYNRLGLFTLGGYYKELTDIDYQRSFPKLENPTDPYFGWILVGPINSKQKSIVKGFEVEIQTNLAGLPSPFDGIVLYANFSKIWSQTYYPYFEVYTKLVPYPPFVISTAVDTLREGKVVGQADILANFTLGYEKGGFSGRLSMFVQGRTLDFLASRAEFDGYTESTVRWDLAFKQKIFNDLSIFFNFNNLSNVPEAAILGFRDYSTREEFYGWTADFGIQLKL